MSNQIVPRNQTNFTALRRFTKFVQDNFKEGAKQGFNKDNYLFQDVSRHLTVVSNIFCIPSTLPEREVTSPSNLKVQM